MLLDLGNHVTLIMTALQWYSCLGTADKAEMYFGKKRGTGMGLAEFERKRDEKIDGVIYSPVGP